MTTGSLWYAGRNGFYWATTAYPSELNAYDLNFDSTSVVPSRNYGRRDGFTVRHTITPQKILPLYLKILPSISKILRFLFLKLHTCCFTIFPLSKSLTPAPKKFTPGFKKFTSHAP